MFICQGAFMDHIHTVEFDLRFGPLNFEYQIPFPTCQRELLEDVLLTLRGHVATGNQSLLGPQDIRLYLDSVDATKDFIAELRSIIELQDQQRLRSEYRAALDSWIKLARSLGAAYGGDPEVDAQRAEELLQTEPFSALLDQLGNRSAGFSGYLHVFNFLYTAIPLPPVSLRKVVDRINRGAGKEVISPQQPQVVTFATGTCRLFDPHWQPSHVGGNIFVLAEFRYHNTLLDRVVALEKRIEDLEGFIEDQRFPEVT
jgi:hypothetical protein